MGSYPEIELQVPGYSFLSVMAAVTAFVVVIMVVTVTLVTFAVVVMITFYVGIVVKSALKKGNNSLIC